MITNKSAVEVMIMITDGVCHTHTDGFDCRSSPQCAAHERVDWSTSQRMVTSPPELSGGAGSWSRTRSLFPGASSGAFVSEVARTCSYSTARRCGTKEMTNNSV